MKASNPPYSSDPTGGNTELAVWLKRSLPPDDLSSSSDAELEAMLDAAPSSPDVDVAGLMASSVNLRGHLSLPSGRTLASPAGGLVRVLGFVTLFLGLVVVTYWSLRGKVVKNGGNRATTNSVTGEWKMEFPPPVFVGTPADFGPGEIENLEERHTPRLSLRLPTEARNNVALGKVVTSSDSVPLVGELSSATDGMRGTEGYVELDSGFQWIQIDLAQTHQIYGIMVWHDYATESVYTDVVVQISNDSEFKSGVATVFNNDHDGSAGLGKGLEPAYVETNYGRIVDIKGAAGRFVRFYSRGHARGSENRYVEVEVFGSPKE
jgi:hypothetical protein